MKDIENYLEKEKVDILLATAEACNFRDYLMLRILWRTGMRISELLTVRPQDLEVHNQVINITKAKGNKQRRVMLDPETFTMLSDYISNTNTPLRLDLCLSSQAYGHGSSLRNTRVWRGFGIRYTRTRCAIVTQSAW